MNVYVYKADIYCKDCGELIRRKIASRDIVNSGVAPADPDDETSYDSDEFPKGPFPDGGGEADSPQHCGEHGRCVNAIRLQDKMSIGVMLENDLTAYGMNFVKEAIAEGGEVAKLWAEFYADYLN